MFQRTSETDIDFVDSDLSRLIGLIRENSLDEVAQLLDRRPELVNRGHEGVCG